MKEDDYWVQRVIAARQLCQEASFVLTSLRGGPPHVARGDLAQDLIDLREYVAVVTLEEAAAATTTDPILGPVMEEEPIQSASTAAGDAADMASAPPPVADEPRLDSVVPSPPQSGRSHPFDEADMLMSGNTDAASPNQQWVPVNMYNNGEPFPPANPTNPLLGGPVARPFLQVVVDPRASGPHTLVALRAIYRLVERGCFQHYHVPLQDILQGVLSCKFEQTDPGADEAVEMAIADVLCILVQQNDSSILPNILMDAFNTVFVTRNTFVHSPALCYHFEHVLTNMIMTVFHPDHVHRPCARVVLEFLVNQLLHTPLVGGDGLDDSTREAQMAHDANRVLCLRLVRVALSTGWTEKYPPDAEAVRPLVQTIQDDLCLSLLMTGQAIWAYHDANSNISPGFVSTEVLSEICATIAILWNTLSLRAVLTSQFETILTGFYTRALVLLRKRRQPTDSLSFNANLIFDAEIEIILESLVDILRLHNHQLSIADGDGGALETIFSTYDCHMRRSDVAMGLIVELTRCCGGTVDPDGQAAMTPSSSSLFEMPSAGNNGKTPSSTPADVVGSDDAINRTAALLMTEDDFEEDGSESQDQFGRHDQQQPWRHVPPHLKELCAQAIMGAMKCLFRDDKASAETVLERTRRKRSILLRQVHVPDSADMGDGTIPACVVESPGANRQRQQHFLRDLKSRKRLMRKAARIFNKKASRGIQFLVDAGLIAEPVTPASVATFLRNGIVVGLDKRAAGAYLGEAGKSPVAGKSPPNWERDWFHKDVLQVYCSLFRFENQSLLDGLRMFLAAFRLPGEAQQIDRILQAFADSCGQVCEESNKGRLRLFSDDPKRASDAAYLLSFSIIMLNTDQHNNNIRADRKMSADDFVKNNTDYGRDITEKGKEFPREYLIGIYESIREEEIRTEGEGADGAMTVERWKDVLRGSTEITEDNDGFHPSKHDVEDLTEIVLEHAWKPIISAIGALWGATHSRYVDPALAHGHRRPSMSSTAAAAENPAHGGMLGVQGSRLGMDMALEMLYGVQQLGRIDVFRKIFSCVCDFTGLVGDYKEDSIERAWVLSNSVEAQSAVVVTFKIASESGEYLDEECWKQVWAILFELRDLKLIARGNPKLSASVFHESETDLLTESARRDWNMCIVKGDMEYDVTASKQTSRSSYGVLGAFGRALFGSDDSSRDDKRNQEANKADMKERSAHGKEELVIWDEGAPSDDENDSSPDDSASRYPDPAIVRSPGAQFEDLLIRENMEMNRRMDMPVTGLERVEDTRRYQTSPRARVRGRFRRSCNFESLVVDSRFMDERGIRALLKSLISMISHVTTAAPTVHIEPRMPRGEPLERSFSDVSSTGSSIFAALHYVPLSPASEAFAEVLVCEIALKNKDRLKELWSDVLQDHYFSRLTSLLVNPSGESTPSKVPVDPGLEKRVTGLLRLSIYAVKRKDLANEIISSWKYLLPMNADQHAISPLRALDRHMGEGLWRIVAQVDDLVNLKDDGWEGLISLINYCAVRGASLKPIKSRDGKTSLPEDDVALQCYRALHLILSTKELDEKVPSFIVDSLRVLVSAGEKRNYSQLSIATLDLLGILLEKKLALINNLDNEDFAKFWVSCWRRVVEGLAEASERSSDSNVRQHSLSMLTDLFLDKQGALVPTPQLCGVLSEVCVPLAGRCIARLQMGNNVVANSDEMLIEFELCIGLIFKPLRHHLKNVLDTGASLSHIWKSVLSVLEELLSEKRTEVESPDRHRRHTPIPDGLKKTMNNLANEHFHNAIMVLITAGVLSSDPKSPGDITDMTWEAAGRMGISERAMQQWKQAAAKPPGVVVEGETTTE